MLFEVSGVEVAWWIPPLVSFAIALIVSTGGLSGAFALLPYQVSVLGFTTPAVTPTNHLYNVVAIPGGVYRYFKEGRMLWPLTLVIVAGTLPGVAVGSWVRIQYIADPRAFKLFMGVVLLMIGGRMLVENVLLPLLQTMGFFKVEKKEVEPVEITSVVVEIFTLKRLQYRFGGRSYHISVPWLFGLTSFVGILGGAYGVGGGALIAPVLVGVWRLPVFTIAGATLFGTLVTSVFAVLFFTLLAPLYGSLPVSPDWTLGILFGLGGLCGTYLGARLQRYLPQSVIKSILGLGLGVLSARYIIGYFF